MKWIKYEYVCGTDNAGAEILEKKRIGYSDANLAIAQAEAYNGVYTIEEDAIKYKLSGPIITPEMYGAVGDGLTDDSDAIQAAIDAAGNTGVVSLAKKVYRTEKSLVFSHRPSIFRCDGTISYTGTGCAIIVARSQVNLDIAIIDAPNGTAIQMNSGNHGLSCGTHDVGLCSIKVGQITSSKIGLHEFTDNKPQTYNKFVIDRIVSSETCVFVENLGEDSQTIYINEHKYWFVKLTGAKTGIKLVKGGSHIFFSGSFEGLQDDGCALHLINSSHTKVRGFRCAENYGKNSVVFEGVCGHNDLEFSIFGLEEIDISKLVDDTYSIKNTLRSTWIGITSHRLSYAEVSGAHGILYDPTMINTEVNVDETTFASNVIKQVNCRIPTTINFSSTIASGTKFRLARFYSEQGCITRGCPVTVSFPEEGANLILEDYFHTTILDNTDGKYNGKIVSVRWNGHHRTTNESFWFVQVLGDSTTGDVVLESNDGSKYRVVVKDNGLLTTEVIAAKNQVPLSIDTDGTVYNGCGYIDGYRINSSGNNTAADCTSATGYISVVDNDTLKMTGNKLEGTADVLAVYDKDFNFIGSFTGKAATYGIFAGSSSPYKEYGLSSVVESDGALYWTVPAGANIAYVRISTDSYNTIGYFPGVDMCVIIDNGSKQTPVVESVNGKTGAVQITTEDIGAEKSGTATNVVNAHNTSEESHNDIRLLISGLATRLNALANSDDTTLDQMAEVVAYIKNNKSLIDGITTSKVSVSDIIDNLTTSASNKPLSAKQGVALKALIEAIVVPTKASDIGAVANTEKLTMVGVDADGKSHTWTIYGKVVS